MATLYTVYTVYTAYSAYICMHISWQYLKVLYHTLHFTAAQLEAVRYFPLCGCQLAFLCTSSQQYSYIDGTTIEVQYLSLCWAPLECSEWNSVWMRERAISKEPNNWGRSSCCVCFFAMQKCIQYFSVNWFNPPSIPPLPLKFNFNSCNMLLATPPELKWSSVCKSNSTWLSAATSVGGA